MDRAAVAAASAGQVTDMDLFTLIKVVFRRWYVVLPVLAATIGLAYQVQTTVPSEFQANGWLVMQPPDLEGAGGAIDPVFLSQGIELADGAQYTVSPAEEGRFGIAVSADSAGAAEDGIAVVIAALDEAIASVQEANDVAPAQRQELRTESPDVVAEVQEDGTYVAQAGMYLYNSTPITPNPYTLSEGTATLLQVTVNGQTGQRRYAELAGPGVGFTLGLGDDGGLLSVLTFGSDERQVVEGFDHVGTLANETLDQLQDEAGVDPSNRLTVEVADAPLAASDVSPPLNRAVAGILALGGLLALGLAIGLESVMRRRAGGGEPGTSVPLVDPSPTAGPSPAPPQTVTPQVVTTPTGPAAGEANHADAASPAEVAASPAEVAARPAEVVASPAEVVGVSTEVGGDAREAQVPTVVPPAVEDLPTPAASREEVHADAAPVAREVAREVARDPVEHPSQSQPSRVEPTTVPPSPRLAVGSRSTDVEATPGQDGPRDPVPAARNGKAPNGTPAGRMGSGGRRTLRTESVRFMGDGGPVSGHLALPPAGTGPGVVVIQEWWGLTEHIKQVADRLAAAGFVALAPDLYGDGVTTTDPERAGSLMQQLSVEQAATDLGAAVDFLLDHPAVTGTSVGAVGFSMGGGFVLVLAAQEGSRIGAVVPYYSLGAYDLVDLSRITAPVLGHFGSDDAFAPPGAARELEQTLRAARSPSVTIHVHDGADHFFANEDDDFGTHDPGLARSAWRETVAFLRERLG